MRFNGSQNGITIVDDLGFDETIRHTCFELNYKNNLPCHVIFLAINILQKSANGYYGELLPTLTTVQKKLNAIQPKTRTSAVILDSVREGLHKRFGTFLRMENEEALIATCSHPFFKLRWTSKEDGRASNLEDLLVRAAETCGFVPEPLPGEESFPALEDSFFEFDVQTPPPRTPQHHLRAEVYRYLEDQRHEMCMLHDFPAVKAVFLRFNTNLCSSAAVERLFSFANMTLRPNRQRLTDGLFEKLLLLKCN